MKQPAWDRSSLVVVAFGYVDHPPLIPWIARLADEIGGGLVTLRVPAILAGTLPMLSIQEVDAAMGTLLGWAVPPIALTHDLHGMHGWERPHDALSLGARGKAGRRADRLRTAARAPKAALSNLHRAGTHRSPSRATVG